MASGEGVVQWFQNGELSERGEGEFIEGKCHGFGTHDWLMTGQRYVGEYKKGKKHGIGVLFYGNGDQYEGKWQEDNKHGKGKLILSDGGCYEGWN